MARYNLQDPRDLMAAYDYLNHAKEQGFDIELRRFSPARSNRQNAFLHLILAYFAHCYGCTLTPAPTSSLSRQPTRTATMCLTTAPPPTSQKTRCLEPSATSSPMPTCTESNYRRPMTS